MTHGIAGQPRVAKGAARGGDKRRQKVEFGFDLRHGLGWGEKERVEVARELSSEKGMQR
jgi:hypothetical protein